jgi:hypothetical protein
MPELVRSAVADASGIATLTIADVPSGLVWIVSQTSVEAFTTNVAITATIRKNGRYLTSTNQGNASSAGGLPYLRLVAGDNYVITWTGLNPADTAIVNMLYNEMTWQASQSITFGVV